MKKDITVIIPINDILQDQFSDWFEKCINSIESQTVKPEKVLIVVTTDENKGTCMSLRTRRVITTQIKSFDKCTHICSNIAREAAQNV